MQNQLESRDKRIALPAIFIVSALAVIFLVWLIYFNQAAPGQAAWVEQMPWLNATFNGISAICLVQGFRAIMRKEPKVHMRYMVSAFVSSSFFLVSYIIYHSLHGDTKFLAQGLIRPIYFFTLISHIGLSIVALPLVFMTFYFSLTRRFAIHRKLARVTFPLWLYVSVTGVLIVFMLKFFNLPA
jgi:putative membrane protein